MKGANIMKFTNLIFDVIDFNKCYFYRILILYCFLERSKFTGKKNHSYMIKKKWA